MHSRLDVKLFPQTHNGDQSQCQCQVRWDGNMGVKEIGRIEN